MLLGLLEDLKLKPKDLAFFTQNDAYGDAGYAGAMNALKERGVASPELLPHGRYPRNTVDVEDALARLLDPRVSPKAVIMVGAYKPCAKFIRLAKRYGLHAIFANVSFVGSLPLREELAADGEGVVVTQVVPHWNAALPITEDYRRATSELDFIALEGFAVGRAFVEALRIAGPNATSEDLVDALESGGPIDLGFASPFTLSKTNHQLSTRVWPTFIHKGEFVPMKNWADLRSAGTAP